MAWPLQRDGATPSHCRRRSRPQREWGIGAFVVVPDILIYPLLSLLDARGGGRAAGGIAC